MKKNKILILFAHPLYEKSKVNQIINQYIPKNEYITFHDLYELYPEFEIDVRNERKLLLEHDIIIWQHPVYWYSSPALLKQWMDMVLHFRGVNEVNIDVLEGKSVLQVVSLGEQTISYNSLERDFTPIQDFLLPFRKSAEFCKMNYLPPFEIKIPKNADDKLINEKGTHYKYILDAMTYNFVSAREFMNYKSMNEWIETKQKSFG